MSFYNAEQTFSTDQWWFKELENLVENGTLEQKRALAVVTNLVNQHRDLSAQVATGTRIQDEEEMAEDIQINEPEIIACSYGVKNINPRLLISGYLRCVGCNRLILVSN